MAPSPEAFRVAEMPIAKGVSTSSNADSATATGSLARALDLTGLNTENGHEFEIYIEEGISVKLQGTMNATKASCLHGVRLGAGAKSIVLMNVQINSALVGAYSDITIDEGAQDIVFVNSPATTSGATLKCAIESPNKVQFINAPEGLAFTLSGDAPVNSSFNGKPLTTSKKWPRFKVETVSTTDLANQTGDGTEVNSATLAGIASYTEVYDDSGAFASGVFTAPVSGLYEFTAKCAITGFSATNTSAELQLIENHAGTPLRYMLDKRLLASPGSSDRYDLRGCEQVLMTAGETMVWSITVNGTGKTVDLVRAINPATYQFSGTLLDYLT